MLLSQRQAVMVLAGLPDLGPVTIARLLHYYNGDARAVLSACADDLRPLCQQRQLRSILNWQSLFDVEREEERLCQLGARFVLREDPDYPSLLALLPDAPAGLYVSGGLQVQEPAVAVVGTRQPSAYGIKMTRQFVSGLVAAGVQVVSGLARGVDTIAHEEVLRLGGQTHAVLGGGLDVIYPRENRRLYQEMAVRGAIWSEFPCGRPVDRQSFPQRNRIVAGMTSLTLIIESGEQGGSMITARFASEQNRLVCAVPGRVDQTGSGGCHKLIREGAVLVESVEQVLEELAAAGVHLLPVAAKGEFRQDLNIDEDAMPIANSLRASGALHLDQLYEQLGLPIYQISALLMRLELQRLVHKLPDGRYEWLG